jgi:hypothetical protein
MESFKQNYLKRCAELDVEPLHNLSNIFKENEILYKDNNKQPQILNLSAISLSLKACDALSSAIQEDTFFTKISINDAFLGDDGI